MIEFQDIDFQDLYEENGILLTDCEDQRVAIGDGFDYKNIYDFMNAFSNEYSLDVLAQDLGFEDGERFLKQLSINKVSTNALTSDIMYYFKGHYASDLDPLDFGYDPEEEARLEAEDFKYDQAVGK